MATTCKLIAKTTLGSDAANVEFTSIPGTYTDLLLLASARSTLTTAGLVVDDWAIRFNGSTTSSSDRFLAGNGSSAYSGSNGVSGGAAIYFGNVVGANSTADVFSNSEVYIPNYAGSTNKSVSITQVSERNGTESYINAIAGLWSNTAAITSIRIYSTRSANIKSGSSFFLYGITKA